MNAPVKVAAWLSLPPTFGGLTVITHRYWMEGHFNWLSRWEDLFFLSYVPALLSLPASAVLLGFACVVTFRRRISWRPVWQNRSGSLVWGLVAWSWATRRCGELTGLRR
jgi:hypothetical protein